MKITTAYKLLRRSCDVLRSANASIGNYSITYKPFGITVPKLAGSKLYVFDSVLRAEQFHEMYRWPNMELWEVDAINAQAGGQIISVNEFFFDEAVEMMWAGDTTFGCPAPVGSLVCDGLSLVSLVKKCSGPR